MKQLAYNIQDTFLGYNKDEFMPIYVEGQLANKSDFVRYKAQAAVKALFAR